ncbi:hypothetical protein DSUL_50025 [Desulfovibrionales bacterium]
MHIVFFLYLCDIFYFYPFLINKKQRDRPSVPLLIKALMLIYFDDSDVTGFSVHHVHSAP